MNFSFQAAMSKHDASFPDAYFFNWCSVNSGEFGSGQMWFTHFVMSCEGLYQRVTMFIVIAGAEL